MNEEPLTDGQIAELAGQLLTRIKPLLDAVAGLSSPGAGSPLIGDDRAAAPYKSSHAARRLLGAATEHLDALYALLMVARVHHPGAPFTLLRATIETAATATWLLNPGSRPERVHRTLRLAMQDVNDQDRLERAHGLPPPRPVSARRGSIQAVADRAIGTSIQLSAPKITVVLQEIESSTTLRCLAAWQVCSGFAHGRLWPILAILDREEIGESGDGDVLLRTTGSTRSLTWATLTAINATERGIQLYQRRAVGPW